VPLVIYLGLGVISGVLFAWLNRNTWVFFNFLLKAKTALRNQIANFAREKNKANEHHLKTLREKNTVLLILAKVDTSQ